jgi:hypothetical protein
MSPLLWTRCLPDFCWLFAFVLSLGCVYLCSRLPCTFDGWVPILEFLCTGFFFYLGFLTCIWLFLHMGADCFVFIGLVVGDGWACWTRVIMNVWHPISYWFLETRMDKPHCLIHSWWLDQHKASKRNEWPVPKRWRDIQLCGLTFFQVGISFVLFLKKEPKLAPLGWCLELEIYVNQGWLILLRWDKKMV